MASRFMGVAFEATEFFSPLLQKLGISKWFRYLDLTSIIRGVLINPRQVVVWLKELQASSAVIKTILVATAGKIVWDDIEDKIDDLYDKYEGDAKEFMFSLVNDAICAGINDAVLQKFQVQINLTKLYPLNDPTVLENILIEIGKVVAIKLNQKYNTTFTNIYPVETFKQELAHQLVVEVTSSTRRLLSNEDYAGFINALNKLKDSDFVAGALGELAIASGGVMPQIEGMPSISEALALKRYYNRRRQAKYRLTHERVSHAWKLKVT